MSGAKSGDESEESVSGGGGSDEVREEESVVTEDGDPREMAGVPGRIVYRHRHRPCPPEMEIQDDRD